MLNSLRKQNWWLMRLFADSFCSGDACAGTEYNATVDAAADSRAYLALSIRFASSEQLARSEFDSENTP
jgi:hypothetical protein